MNFQNQNILIISPQPWGKFFVSKHHYAIELAKKGNNVFFLNPPMKGSFGMSVEKFKEYNIKVVQPKFQSSTFIRFKLPFLYKILVKRFIQKLITSLKVSFDIVWSFDPNLYPDLSDFKAKLKIFHVVDPVNRVNQLSVAKSADVVFSVSNKILDSFKDSSTPRFFINHGIGSAYIEQAKNNLQKTYAKSGEKVKVGYVGNLMRQAIDREVFKEIIDKSQGAEFHLWGPHDINENNLQGYLDEETKTFISYLKSNPKVYLMGSKSSDQLAIEIQEMDMFFLTYKLIEGYSDRSNSHKILEYLSTGKYVLSCRLSTYADSSLIDMPEDDNDFKLLEKLNGAIMRIDELNEDSLMKSRIQYALDHSYEKQLNKIELITQNLNAN